MSVTKYRAVMQTSVKFIITKNGEDDDEITYKGMTLVPRLEDEVDLDGKTYVVELLWHEFSSLGEHTVNVQLVKSGG